MSPAQAAIVVELRQRRVGGRLALTPQQVDVLRELVSASSLNDVALRTGIVSETLRYHIDPEFKLRRQKQIAEARKLRAAGTPRRQYMRGAVPVVVTGSEPRNPLYDPRRDDAPRYESQTAVICGDPPVGRREMLERNANATRPRVRAQESWHL